MGNELGVLEKQAAGAVSGPKSKRDKAGREDGGVTLVLGQWEAMDGFKQGAGDRFAFQVQELTRSQLWVKAGSSCLSWVPG